jgi:hypothetical protein
LSLCFSLKARSRANGPRAFSNKSRRMCPSCMFGDQNPVCLCETPQLSLDYHTWRGTWSKSTTC